MDGVRLCPEGRGVGADGVGPCMDMAKVALALRVAPEADTLRLRLVGSVARNGLRLIWSEL